MRRLAKSLNYETFSVGGHDDWQMHALLKLAGAVPGLLAALDAADKEIAHRGGFVTAARATVAAVERELDAAEAERDRLAAELDLWRPLTPAEAERALAEAKAEPLSEERIAEIVRRATDPAVQLPNNEQAQLAAERDRLKAEVERLRAAAHGVVLACRQCHGAGLVHIGHTPRDGYIEALCPICGHLAAALKGGSGG